MWSHSSAVRQKGEFWDCRDLAASLGLHPQTPWAWMRDGLLRGTHGRSRAGKPTWRYDADAVAELVARIGRRLLKRAGLRSAGRDEADGGVVAGGTRSRILAQLGAIGAGRIPTARQLSQRVQAVDVGMQGVGTWRTRAQPAGTWVTCEVLEGARGACACACGDAVGACVAVGAGRYRGGAKLGGRSSSAYSPPSSTVSRRELTGTPVMDIEPFRTQDVGMPEWSLT